jgi:antirestriction protein ArdC
MGDIRGYTSPFWGTYKQVSEKGGKVRSTEGGHNCRESGLRIKAKTNRCDPHSDQDNPCQNGPGPTIVVFWKVLEKKGQESIPPKDRQTFAFLKYYQVWNADQCNWVEGDERWWPKEDTTDHQPIQEAQDVFDNYVNRDDGPKFREGGDTASYSPALDTINLPALKQFDGPEEYYSTAFHEATHSTGAETRLARPNLLSFHHFGDESYSKEELVAEMGAAMLCAIVGIEQTVTIENSAAYVQHWLTALRDDTKLVVQAASAAERAAKLIVGDTLDLDSNGDAPDDEGKS